MKTSTFRIVPLSTEVAERARRAVEAGAADHAFVIADSPTGYPCRHCLRFAKAGERMILFPHAAIPAGHAYSESGPIFVHAVAKLVRIFARASQRSCVSCLQCALRHDRCRGC